MGQRHPGFYQEAKELVPLLQRLLKAALDFEGSLPETNQATVDELFCQSVTKEQAVLRDLAVNLAEDQAWLKKEWHVDPGQEFEVCTGF